MFNIKDIVPMVLIIGVFLASAVLSVVVTVLPVVILWSLI